MIDIVMVTFNRLKMTRKALEHLYERTEDFRLIVVDNGSSDCTPDLLWDYYDKHKNIQLIFTGQNYGIHHAKNVGLEHVKSDLYVDTDNDILCAEGWLPKLVGLMDRYTDFGAIACRPQILVGEPGGLFKDCGEVLERPHVGASLRIMRTEAIKLSGWRKNYFKPGRNNEERWICGKLKDMGYKVGYARDVHCWHMFGENWGYGDIPMEVHGHRPISPPPEVYDNIKRDPKTWGPL